MKFLNNEKAFTLIEVMTSLVVILILVLAFSGAFINSLRSENIIDERLEIQNITNSIIEILRNNEIYNKSEFKSINFGDYDYLFDIFENGESYNDDADVLIEYNKHEDFTNLYLVEIRWPEDNYSTEILLAGAD
jgi:prepilin-type N-terminal cleavage/methylation domain-containing protein